MRSGIGPADHLRALGIDVVLDLPGVGENLADHPGVDLELGWTGNGDGGGLTHSIVTLRGPTARSDEAPDLMFWISDPDPADPGFWLDPILLKPGSRGSVRLRSADPAAAPVITLPGVRTSGDVERLVEGYRLALDVAGHPTLRPFLRAVPDAPTTGRGWRQRIADNAYSLPHVVGTCAMGPGPASGAVVDTAGRVHGVHGLRVIDASIIPDPPSGFPHVIAIMVAAHLSERLIQSGIAETSGPLRA